MNYYFSDEVTLYRKPMKKIYFLKVSSLLLLTTGLLAASPKLTAGSASHFAARAATPPVVNMESFTVRDDAAAGCFVGQLTASGSNLQWQLADDETKGAFRLDASGRIYVNNTTLLQSNRGKLISLFVSASDGVETSNLAEITIAIQDTYINIPPTLDPIADRAVCAGRGADTIQLTGMSAVEPDQTYSLVAIADLPMLETLQVTNDGQLTFRVKTGINAGACMVTVMIKDNGGVRNGGQDTRTRSFNITVNGIPNVGIVSDKGTVVPKGELLTLTASGADHYSWTPAPGLEGETGAATVTVKPVKTTRYEVVATNNSGCQDTAHIDIRVVADFIIRANNVLTPNNDGRNDRWIIQSLEDYPENEVIITDRAGRVIFKQRNYSNTWDGKLNGQRLAEGTYFYTFSVFNTVTKTTDVARGYITILGD